MRNANTVILNIEEFSFGIYNPHLNHVRAYKKLLSPTLRTSLHGFTSFFLSVFSLNMPYKQPIDVFSYEKHHRFFDGGERVHALSSFIIIFRSFSFLVRKCITKDLPHASIVP